MGSSSASRETKPKSLVEEHVLTESKIGEEPSKIVDKKIRKVVEQDSKRKIHIINKGASQLSLGKQDDQEIIPPRLEVEDSNQVTREADEEAKISNDFDDQSQPDPDADPDVPILRVNSKGALKEAILQLTEPFVQIIDESQIKKAQAKKKDPKPHATINLEQSSIVHPVPEFPDEHMTSLSVMLIDKEKNRGVSFCFMNKEDFEEWVPYLHDITLGEVRPSDDHTGGAAE